MRNDVRDGAPHQRKGIATVKKIVVITEDLITERLTLIAHSPDLVTVKQVAWLNDPDVVKYSEQRHLGHDIWSQRDYVSDADDAGHIWLIRLGDQDIGTISAAIDKRNSVADMGILIGRKDLYGQGYATEAWAAVMQWLFNRGIRKIECGCMSVNLGMREVAIKCGMQIDGGRKGHFLLDGKPQDLVYYGKIRE